MPVQQIGTRRMLLSTLTSFAAAMLSGLLAWTAWLFLLVTGTGTSQRAEVVILYSAGIAIAAGAGITLGQIRRGERHVIAIVAGWVASLPLNPAFIAVRNPASSGESDYWLWVLVVFSAAAGIACSLVSSHGSRRTLIVSAAAALAATLAFGIVAYRLP